LMVMWDQWRCQCQVMEVFLIALMLPLIPRLMMMTLMLKFNCRLVLWTAHHKEEAMTVVTTSSNMSLSS
jgi:hypothetical protein